MSTRGRSFHTDGKLRSHLRQYMLEIIIIYAFVYLLLQQTTEEEKLAPSVDCCTLSCDLLLSQVLNCGTISCQTRTNMMSMMFPLLCFSWFWVSTTGSPTRRCSQQQLSWAGGWRHWVNIPKTTLPFSARREPSGSSRPRPASCTTSAVSLLQPARVE